MGNGTKCHIMTQVCVRLSGSSRLLVPNTAEVEAAQYFLQRLDGFVIQVLPDELERDDWGVIFDPPIVVFHRASAVSERQVTRFRRHGLDTVQVMDSR